MLHVNEKWNCNHSLSTQTFIDNRAHSSGGRSITYQRTRPHTSTVWQYSRGTLWGPYCSPPPTVDRGRSLHGLARYSPLQHTPYNRDLLIQLLISTQIHTLYLYACTVIPAIWTTSIFNFKSSMYFQSFIHYVSRVIDQHYASMSNYILSWK